MKKVLVMSLMLIGLVSCGNSDKPDLSTMWFQGAGANPFWNFQYMDGVISWQSLGENGVAEAAFNGTSKYELNHVKIEGTDNDFEAKLTEEACSDGITDIQYTHSITVKVAGTEYKGCGQEWQKPEIQGAAQRSVTVETGSGTQATITNTAVQVDGQVVGAVTVSTGAVDDAEAMMDDGEYDEEVDEMEKEMEDEASMEEENPAQ